MVVSTAVDLSAIARVLGIKTAFKDLRGGSILFLPQRLAIVGQGASAITYSTTKAQFSNASIVGETYGFGSPLHLASQQLFPVNGDGIGTIPATFFPLVDDASGVASAGDITPSGSATEAASFLVRMNNIDSEEFVIDIGASVATMVTSITEAIQAILSMPMLASDDTTEVGLLAKWEGTSSNDIVVEVIGPTNVGVSFAITQPVGGLINPSIDPALAQIGDVWESMLLNCLEIDDTTALDDLSNFGEGRWGALVRRPLVAFTGNPATSVANATVVSDARKTDRTNAQLVAPGSTNLPFVVAARQLARIVVVANNNPPRDYGSQDATGLVPGADGSQWTFPERDEAIKKGSSSIQVKDGVINVSDTVTFFHPMGEPIPGFRYVVDIVKLQQVLFNLDLIFATNEWDGAPLIPDIQPTTNREAKKPSMAHAEIAAMLDSLALNAIISDPETAKTTIVVEISGTNPKRVDAAFSIQLSGNSNIISIDNNFGFFFGVTSLALAA